MAPPLRRPKVVGGAHYQGEQILRLRLTWSGAASKEESCVLAEGTHEEQVIALRTREHSGINESVILKIVRILIVFGLLCGASSVGLRIAQQPRPYWLDEDGRSG